MKETEIMAHARATFLTTYLSWVKPSLLAVLLGGLTATFALVVQASNAVPVILKTLNIPACLTYADVYRGTQSDFRKEGVLWREYAPEAAAFTYEFKEFLRTRDEILIRNLTPREQPADWATLVIHLPVCGGIVKMTEGMPEKSTDLEQVWRAPRAR
jgi:hypothetical protein